eukprot:7389684-Prymnesium_polylepis.1
MCAGESAFAAARPCDAVTLALLDLVASTSVTPTRTACRVGRHRDDAEARCEPPSQQPEARWEPTGKGGQGGGTRGDAQLARRTPSQQPETRWEPTGKEGKEAPWFERRVWCERRSTVACVARAAHGGVKRAR